LPAGKQLKILRHIQTKVNKKMAQNRRYFDRPERSRTGLSQKNTFFAPPCLHVFFIQGCIIHPAAMFIGFSLSLTHLPAYQGP
jgi:hypothetical protein